MYIRIHMLREKSAGRKHPFQTVFLIHHSVLRLKTFWIASVDVFLSTFSMNHTIQKHCIEVCAAIQCIECLCGFGLCTAATSASHCSVHRALGCWQIRLNVLVGGSGGRPCCREVGVGRVDPRILQLTQNCPGPVSNQTELSCSSIQECHATLHWSTEAELASLH